MNQAVQAAGERLDDKVADQYRQKYRKLLEEAEIECPPSDEKERKGKRGRLKRNKARNLLEGFIDYEPDTLRFMVDEKVPFTNNQGENDIPLTKVQQKISGVFGVWRVLKYSV